MKTLILSIDALFSADIEEMKKIPGFEELFENSVVVNDLREIYPALTYPCHTTIVTGNLPKTHGIYQNTVFAPQRRSEDWTWYHNQIQCKTLFDYFCDDGKTTAAVFWPVTVNAPVDYLIPEMWALSGKSENILRDTSSKAVGEFIDSHIDKLDFSSKKMQDEFATECTVDTVSRYNPDVVFLHYCILDQTRHRYGIRHEECKNALKQCGSWFERILRNIKQMNPGEEIVKIVLGDHGHLECTSSISINYLFAKRGYIDPGRLLQYKAYCHCAGISAQVFVRDHAINEELINLFDKLVVEGLLLKYYTKEDYDALGLNGKFSFVLEAANGYAFTDSMDQFITSAAKPFGAHGHLPCRGDMPPLIVASNRISGSAVRSGYGLVDIAPTICRIHNITPESMNGSAIESITQYFENRH